MGNAINIIIKEGIKMAKKSKKTQVIELEVNELMAECLIQVLRHPNWLEIKSAIKENLGIDSENVISETLESLENEVSDQIMWTAF